MASWLDRQPDTSAAPSTFPSIPVPLLDSHQRTHYPLPSNSTTLLAASHSSSLVLPSRDVRLGELASHQLPTTRTSSSPVTGSRLSTASAHSLASSGSRTPGQERGEWLEARESRRFSSASGYENVVQGTSSLVGLGGARFSQPPSPLAAAGSSVDLTPRPSPEASLDPPSRLVARSPLNDRSPRNDLSFLLDALNSAPDLDPSHLAAASRPVSAALPASPRPQSVGRLDGGDLLPLPPPVAPRRVQPLGGVQGLSLGGAILGLGPARDSASPPPSPRGGTYSSPPRQVTRAASVTPRPLLREEVRRQPEVTEISQGCWIWDDAYKSPIPASSGLGMMRDVSYLPAVRPVCTAVVTNAVATGPAGDEAQAQKGRNFAFRFAGWRAAAFRAQAELHSGSASSDQGGWLDQGDGSAAQ